MSKPKPPLSEDAGRFLRKIIGELPSLEGTAGYRMVIKAALNREAAACKAGTKGPLRRAIERICEVTKADTLDAVLAAIEENEDLVPDLFHSLSAPIDITDVEIDYERGEIRYRTRFQL
jgi:hypothetical protein